MFAPHQLFVVGCEPAILEREDGALGLSDKVRAAIPIAIEMIDELLRDLLAGKKISGSHKAIPSETDAAAILKKED